MAKNTLAFHVDTIKISLKDHKCNVCGCIIKHGEEHHEKYGIDHDYQSFQNKECKSCQPVINEFCMTEYAHEGYSGELISEWWKDEKCYTCRHYYLTCEPHESCKKYMPVGAESYKECTERTKYGTCMAVDTCNSMTHYCRCDQYEQIEK